MRKILLNVVLASGLLALVAGTSYAEAYRWVDKNGVVGFADTLQKVPPEYRSTAKRVDGTQSSSGSAPKPLQVVPSLPRTELPPDNSEERYSAWRGRLRNARAEVEQLRSQREAAQKEYETLRAEFYVRSFGDPEADAEYRAKIAELDQQIHQKEEEINTTIPDEARRAGIPAGVLNE